ncbi:hypothetical protein ACN47E_007414 [Coniothyrium glycines]
MAQPAFFRQLYAHIALPNSCDVPGAEDQNLHLLEAAILTRLVQAAQLLVTYTLPPHTADIEGLKATLLAAKALNVHGTISRSALLRELDGLALRKTLLLHVTAQNCAVLIYNDHESAVPRVMVEAFETSPPCEVVLACKNALRWTFPGSTVAVPSSTFAEPALQESLASFLQQASTEVVAKFCATTVKASAPLPEIRDTSSPDIITGLLMSILEANGDAVVVPLLQKRVRDTVSWAEARKPWRRSPFYLALRVTMQRFLYRHLGPEIGRLYYKVAMALMLSQFLEDSLRRLSLDAAYFLRQKLGRRLAKLTSDMHTTKANTKEVYKQVLQAIEPRFTTVLATTGGYLKAVWRNDKLRNAGNVAALSPKGCANDCNLVLLNSNNRLRQILNCNVQQLKQQVHNPHDMLRLYEETPGSTKLYMAAVNKCSARQSRLVNDIMFTQTSATPDGHSCIELSKAILCLTDMIVDATDAFSDEKSQLILHLIELWVRLDVAAVRCFPLLKEFHPGLTSCILDSLLVPDLEQLERLRDVHIYLEHRCHRPGKRGLTVFDQPSDDCFAVRYYDESDLSNELLDIREEIEETAAAAYIAKEVEWEEKSAQYTEAIQKRDQVECKWDLVTFKDGTSEHKHRWPCEWHALHNKAKSMKIKIFEHPLPSFEPAAKAALFELRCPEAFAAYRDATWRLISALCLPVAKPLSTFSLLRDYSPLQDYVEDNRWSVTLGSDKKAHIDSHYSTWSFPVGLAEVRRTCGLKLKYVDTATSIWTEQHTAASFWHHFPVNLPRDSPYRTLDLSFASWPNSNQVQASQPSCPPDISIHEYLGWQGLLSGSHSRWLDLLRELASTNLNFSSESTLVLVRRLVHQAGPSTFDNAEARRDVHAIFLEEDFCHKLLSQIQPRLESIRRNWRDYVQMDLLITILLKIVTLSPNADIQHRATISLGTARSITDSWRAELQSIAMEDSRVLPFIVWASLLCKRTIHSSPKSLIESELLRPFLDASIMLHYHLNARFEIFPDNVQDAIVRDHLFVYNHREEIRNAILYNHECFKSTVGELWQMPQCEEQVISHVPNTYWIQIIFNGEAYRNYAHYNYVYGTFLINGQEMRALPSPYRNHPTYRHIFRDGNPIVFTSPLSGMDFQIANPLPFGHRIHLGFRGGDLIVRAVQNKQVLELVPSQIFMGIYASDLPMTLIENSYHWLNIYTGVMEIRREDIWFSKMNNWWVIGLGSLVPKAVRRHLTPDETRLLEPTSNLARRIAAVFKNFEDPQQIMSYMSINGKVSTELRRYELSFFINDDGLLQSARLQAVITQSQDIGTWYGLRSKIVVQSSANRRQKSVLIPLGPISLSNEGSHVSINIGYDEGLYLRYTVNEILGRIECAPEPILLYTKAFLHACTSSVISDPLTGRTGAEEALYLLKSASYLPWIPLKKGAMSILERISSLSPVRVYYPMDLKRMETVTWRSDLPSAMQDDRYRPIVSKILQRSSALAKFATEAVDSLPVMSHSDKHLAIRALSRSNGRAEAEDTDYTARDRRNLDRKSQNVLCVVDSLSRWQAQVKEGPSLASLLQDATIVGGFERAFGKVLLTDIVSVDLRGEWGALTQRCLQSTFEDRWSLMFLLGSLVFSHDVNMSLVEFLLAYAVVPQVKTVRMPVYPSFYHYRPDGVPRSSYLASLMSKAKQPFNPSGYKKRSLQVVAEHSHETSVEASCDALANSILAMWPHPIIATGQLAPVDNAYLDKDQALLDVTPEWIRLTRNYELTLYLEEVQRILWSLDLQQSPSTGGADQQALPPASRWPTRSRSFDSLTVSQLLQHALDCSGIHEVSRNNTRAKNHHIQKTRMPGRPIALQTEVKELRTIVAQFKDERSFVQRRYAEELSRSIDALQAFMAQNKETGDYMHMFNTNEQIIPARNVAFAVLQQIRAALKSKDPQSYWLSLVDLWPRLSIIELLSELRETKKTAFGPGAKEALVAFALTITSWQRLLRIRDAQKRRHLQQEQREWANQGHSNWDPIEHTDWLLLEIDGDLLLREEQIEVALETIAPATGENAVLQLLMGKGKTSCILPMVASVLANKEQLNRVVVPRALLLQSAQVMQSRLGGLVNRQVIHIPISRKTPTNKRLMTLYEGLLTHARANQATILTLPEHILSFKLSGIQQLCDNRTEEAATMIRIQEWLDKYCRDVLDECDVSLATRTQLIYPSGSQSTVDGHPLRWQVTQILLHLVKDLVVAVQDRHPQSIEIVRRGPDSFPLIYFLRRDAEEYLIERLIDIICKGQVPSILPCVDYPTSVKQDMKVYITSANVQSELIQRVLKFFSQKPHLQQSVNLLRGLFVHRLLISTLRKRWNVSYGLHASRVPIAVPFLAKGVPSPTAEWGHPDVTIILTCLSFYYQGLTLPQFKQAFEQLTKLDEPSVEYERWFPKGVDIPRELDDYALINVDDASQLHELYRIVRVNIFLVDFYCNNFIFPRFAKTFSLKLVGSGWSLFPSVSVQQTATCQVTGFSGTNDSRHQLPLLIKQNDLRKLAHTNAEVPLYFLQARNASYVRMAYESTGLRWSELDLIDNLANFQMRADVEVRKQGKIRILIDCGAQILEHSNKALAISWLERDHDAAAAVYFEDDHRATVVYRGGRSIPLSASPFVDNLDRCVVYLDESHCRGTDLKFPPHARAALTLGQHLSKDALVQAAMRLRLLGETQSVTFFAPPEVHQGIVDCLHRSGIQPGLNKNGVHRITSAGVLQWVFALTCDKLEQLETLYISQGSHFLHQEQARIDHADFLHSQQSLLAYRNAVRIKETLSLKQLYEPKSQRRTAKVVPESFDPRLQPYAVELFKRKKQFQDQGTAVHATALEEVEIEQEREAEIEVEVEVEDVREVQQPPRFAALKIKPLHGDIIHFAVSGKLVNSDSYQPVFTVLAHTALGVKSAISPLMKSNLWISENFQRTVETFTPLDHYTRSCNWVLWSPGDNKALVVSPEEANTLIPLLRKQTALYAASKTYLIVYAAPVARRMLQFNRLTYHSTPPLPADLQAPVWLRVELGIFSGRLFFEWDEYHELLRYAGLRPDLTEQAHPFATKPLTFLHGWLDVLRKGQDFEHTPMGFVTSGKPLTENHPFFRTAKDTNDERPMVARFTSGGQPAEEKRDDDQDEMDFAPALEHLDDSDSDEEVRDEEEEEDYADALEDLED